MADEITDKEYEEPWMADSACLGVDPDLFFPERGGSTAEARAVCQNCPVKPDCLDFAIVNKIHHGIFGGLTERERRRVARQRALLRSL